MGDRIRWGVVGSGGIARRRTIREGIVASDQAELRMVYDVNATVNAEVARESCATAATSLDAIWQSDVEAVYIASPPCCHLAQVLAAAKAGKHVLCEKPLGMSVEEAEMMVAACRQADVRLGVGLMMRFHAYHQKALQMVEAGQLGKLVLGRAQLSCWYPPMPGAWRQDPSSSGGGSLIDMGAHTIDLLEMLFGPAREVFCHAANLLHPYASEDSAVAILTFESGALGMVDTFFCVPDNASKNRLEIYGSRGSILAEGTIGQAPNGTMVAYLEEDNGQYDAQQARWPTRGLNVLLDPVNTYRAEIEELCHAIREGRDPSNSGKIGLRNAQVLAMCYQSAQTGKTIAV